MTLALLSVLIAVMLAAYWAGGYWLAIEPVDWWEAGAIGVVGGVFFAIGALTA